MERKWTTPTWKKRCQGPAELIWWQDGVPAWQKQGRTGGSPPLHSSGSCPWETACAPCDPKALMVTSRAPSWLSLSNQDEFLLGQADSANGDFPDGVETASWQLGSCTLFCQIAYKKLFFKGVMPVDLDGGMWRRLTLNFLKKAGKRRRTWEEINALEGMRKKHSVQGCQYGGL